MRRRLWILVVLLPMLSLPAQGGIFPKKARPRPEMGLPQLLQTLKGDPDEGKRTSAAAELRDYDGQVHPEIIPVLIDVMQNDTRPSVRREAAYTLGRLRPFLPAAGQALQQAASKDPSLRVRIQAWSSFKIFQLNGYNGRSKENPAPLPSKRRPTTEEPPLADPPASPALAPQTPANPPLFPETPSTPSRGKVISRPLSPQEPPLAPRAPRKFSPPPLLEDEGPILTPSK